MFKTKKECPTCKKHNVRLQGRYCPVCGAKCVPIHLPKLTIYIPLWGAISIGIGLAIFSFLAFFIYPNVPIWRERSDQRKAEQQRIADTLPDEWKDIYGIMTSDCCYCEKLIRSRYEGKKLPPLNAEQTHLIFDVSYYDQTLVEIMSQ